MIRALTPNYPLGCKRIAMDAGWLASLHKAHVNLTNAILVGADENGLVTADGVHHEFDVIIFATVGHCCSDDCSTADMSQL